MAEPLGVADAADAADVAVGTGVPEGVGVTEATGVADVVGVGEAAVRVGVVVTVDRAVDGGVADGRWCRGVAMVSGWWYAPPLSATVLATVSLVGNATALTTTGVAILAVAIGWTGAMAEAGAPAVTGEAEVEAKQYARDQQRSERAAV